MAAMPAETSLSQPSDGICPSNSICRFDTRAISLHFTLASEDVSRCAESLDRLSGVKATHEQIRAVYLDTPDYAIAGLGLAFGIRRRSGTGKYGGWKRFVEPLSPATPKAARRARASCLRQATAIDVVAQAETQRWLWSFFCGGTLIEARLERANIVMNGKTAVLGSLSLRCDAPNAAFLRFVAEICEPDRLRLSAASDLARAYRLCDGPSASYVAAFAPNLDADMDAGAAFRTIATACFDQFLLNEALIRATGNHEAVHQCRVALRRLSACLRFFSGFIGGTDYETLRADLKKLGTYLRDARDLDVMIADVIAPKLAADPTCGANALMCEIEARHKMAHADLVAALCAPSSAALFLRFALWLEAGDWTGFTDQKSVKRRHEPIAKYAREKFEKMHGKFVARCADLGEMDKDDRHRTRIHAKNLRYDTEFFTGLADSKSARKRMLAFIHAVKSLQTVLGDWNDILMARQFLSGFGQTTGTESEPKTNAEKTAASTATNSPTTAANALAQSIENISEAEFDEKTTKACQAFGKLKPFWTQLG
ncbi:MAG: CYTH and CHAD domain-containing protein [Methylovirgula sp.]